MKALGEIAKFRRGVVIALLAGITLLGELILPGAVQAADNTWRGEYYSNPWLSGAPALVRSDSNIDFGWGTGSPDGRIPADNFSVRWSRTVYLDSGHYRFAVTADDGVRFYLDGRLLIDRWVDQPATGYAAEGDLGAGEHALRLEYYERAGSAEARLSWSRTDVVVTPGTYWVGNYYPNPWLSGNPTVVRADKQIAFDWGLGSPDARIPTENFSVRWSRNISFARGQYRFTTESDDGIRLFVDGKLLIDRWSDMARSVHTADISLNGGVHSVSIEYYEHSGGAFARVDWEMLERPSNGNIITCVRPADSWVKVYRLESNGWTDVNPRGFGPMSGRGDLKLDGMYVDTARYGDAGHPYRVELWAAGSLVRSIGNTARGEAEFRVRAGIDNPTPWGCPAP